MAGSSATPALGRDQDDPISPVSPVTPGDNPDVFSDDYAESFNESYADSIAAHSIRHSRSPSPSSRRPSLQQRESSRILVPGSASLSHTPSAQSRNSTSKNVDDGSERTREEARRGAGPPVITNFSMRQPSSATAAHRSISSTSEFAGSQSPMSPGEGPSHPYAMYPQGLAMSRTASIASSARPLSHATSIRGPTHPYGLYTQNVADDGPSGTQSNTIPVGFPGSNQNYQRRIGPEGEEQDIVGPDGHTEQLPPYTRYPDEVNHHKTVATSGLPPSGLPVIGEQRAEEASPTSPVHNTSPTTQRTATSIATEAELCGEGTNEKTWEGKSTREKWRTKIFGVPLWFILMIFVMVIIIAIICGAVIGALIGQPHPRKKPMAPKGGSNSSMGQSSSVDGSATSTASLIDVTLPTVTPGWVNPLPTGTYMLNPGYPASVNVSGCLQGAQRPAWSCNLHDDTTLMNFNTTNNTTMISLSPAIPDLQYGVQPPTVTSGQVQLVQDPDTDGAAYAWHFQTFYNKLVVLDEDALMPLNANQKRGAQKPWYAQSGPLNQQKSATDPENVDDGNKAWFCYWNQTFLEVLVYAGKTSNVTVTTSISAPGSTSPTLSSSVTSNPWPNSFSTSMGSYSTTTPSPSLPPGLEVPATPPKVTSSTSYPPRNPDGAWWTGSPVQARDMPTASPSLPPPAPRKIKVEERRVPSVNAPPPTCTLMTQNETDKSWKPCVNPNGWLAVVALYEQDPTVVPPQSTGGQGQRKRDSIPPNACGCQWNAPDGIHPGG